MRRLLAGAALGLLAAAAVVPVAVAHGGHGVSWAGRGDQPALQDGDEVYAVDFLDLATTNDGYTKWRIEMVHEATGLTSYCEADVADPSTNNQRFSCNWDTNHIGDMTSLTPGQTLEGAAPAPNGIYKITGKAWAPSCFLVCGGQEPAEEHVPDPAEFKLIVTNDVSKPTGLTQSFNSETRNIHVAWNKNPEPDATYVLEERINGGAWTKHNRGTATTFDRAGDPGVYEYRVVASRPEAPHKTSDITPPLEIAPPPADPGPSDPGTVDPAPGGPAPTSPTTPSTSGTTATTARPRQTTTRPRNSEQSRGLGGSNLFTRPTVRPAPPSTTVTTVDDGYEEAITYPTQPPRAVEMPGEERAVERLVTEERPVDARAVLLSLAGGLAVFVLAMQMIFMARRRPSLATTYEDDWA